MEPLTIIITALIAGASKAAGDAIPDGYKALKELIKRKFESKGKEKDGDYILEQQKEELEENQDFIKQKLQKVEAEKDEEIIQAAQKLLKKENPKEAANGTYDLRDAKGVQIGNHNIQTNHNS